MCRDVCRCVQLREAKCKLDPDHGAVILEAEISRFFFCGFYLCILVRQPMAACSCQAQAIRHFGRRF